jgi:hypothetical protein
MSETTSAPLADTCIALQGADNKLAWRRLVASGGCNIVAAKEASESASLMHLHASNASSQHTQEW